MDKGLFIEAYGFVSVEEFSFGVFFTLGCGNTCFYFLYSGCFCGLAGLGFMGKSYSMEQAFRISSFQYRIPVRMTPNMAAIKFILPAIKYPFMLMTHLLSILQEAKHLLCAF